MKIFRHLNCEEAKKPSRCQTFFAPKCKIKNPKSSAESPSPSVDFLIQGKSKKNTSYYLRSDIGGKYKLSSLLHSGPVLEPILWHP